MPWHDQQMYLEGLEQDLRQRAEAIERAGGGGEMQGQTETFDLTSSAGLAEMGLNVRQVAQ